MFRKNMAKRFRQKWYDEHFFYLLLGVGIGLNLNESGWVWAISFAGAFTAFVALVQPLFERMADKIDPTKEVAVNCTCVYENVAGHIQTPVRDCPKHQED